MTLLRALQRTCELLESSEDSAWTPKSASQIRSELLEIVAAIQCGADYDKSKLQFLFLPTGAVQEISLANGWGEEMLKLADVVDRHVAGSMHEQDIKSSSPPPRVQSRSLLIASTLCWLWGIFIGLGGLTVLVVDVVSRDMPTAEVVLGLVFLLLATAYCVAGFLVRRERAAGGWIAILTATLL